MIVKIQSIETYEMQLMSCFEENLCVHKKNKAKCQEN